MACNLELSKAKKLVLKLLQILEKAKFHVDWLPDSDFDIGRRKSLIKKRF